ncbi:MAG: hypothetical protein NTW86_28970 [Candidatus Sumerlaeota bacterium]|nr:hypothetical protein [Candidatus Sumerlaeota bacterium]
MKNWARRGAIAAWAWLVTWTGWAADPGVTRDQAVSYLQTCEKVWYNQAYYCRIRSAQYDSIDTIEQNRLYRHGMRLLALAGGMYVDEALTDTLESSRWVRERQIIAFNGQCTYRWVDWENRGTISFGSPLEVFRYPEGLASFFGFQLDRKLSDLIRDANDFAWQGVEKADESDGDVCLKATCVFQTPESVGAKSIRYDLWLAAEGALYPKRIVRYINTGESDLMTGIWEARQIDKDPQTRIWQLREGRFYNLGQRTIHNVEVLNRRPISAEQAKPANFAMLFPKDCQVLDMRSGQTLNAENHKSKVAHPAHSFLPLFANETVETAIATLDASYREGHKAEWAEPMDEPAPLAAASRPATPPAKAPAGAPAKASAAMPPSK